MAIRWTFGRTMAAGFVAVMVLNLAGGLIALVGLRGVVRSKDHVITVDSRLEIQAQELLVAQAEKVSALRAYLLTGDRALLVEVRGQAEAFDATLVQVKRQIHTQLGRSQTGRITADVATAVVVQNQLIAMRGAGVAQKEINRSFNQHEPERSALRSTLLAFSAHEENLATRAVRESSATASRDTILSAGVLLAAILTTTVLAVLMTGYLRRRIGFAVGEVQNSSSEMEETANLQAAGATERSAAMSEISTTITQLLASSQQIAENARRSADAGDQAAHAARSGQQVVTSARRSIDEIRRQVDAVVDHMLALGEKTHRIGSVLDIVSELSEQTNVLAINSKIEAAGGEESRRRYAAVADEIRALADRVATSTKEIRGLIEKVRDGVNTTVMATEVGSKAVDAGAAQYDGLASALKTIVELVATATQSSREIELSTRQQFMAVEQVHLAVADITRTTRQSETSSTQTLRTATHLTALSAKLRLLIEPLAG